MSVLWVAFCVVLSVLCLLYDVFFFVLMIRRPPRSTRTDTLSLHAALPIYWQRLQLDKGLDAMRGVDARASIIPGDPFRYGFPSGAYGRNNSIQETLLDRKSTRLNSSH